MNKETLNLVLKENNVDEAIYDLNGGLPNEKYCINYNTTFWEVYYSERQCGKKQLVKTSVLEYR